VVDLAVDSLKPVFGGSVTVYSDREFWDDNLSDLLRTYPFALPLGAGPSDTAAALLNATQVSEKRLSLSLAPSLRNAAGAPVGAFELAQQWTALIKARPGEGLALFRHVKGIGPFIKGTETVIQGFVVSGKDAVALVLDQPDEHATARLATTRLLPAELKLGPYAASVPVGPSVSVKANRRSESGPPWLESCTVVLGGDRNPALNFSLKKYDCMVMTSKEDVEYARRTLLGDSRLVALKPDRYFVAINAPDINTRRWLRDRINPTQLLSSTVRAEGRVLGAVASDAPVVAQPVSDMVAPPAGAVIVLCRKGDPVSARIAQRLLADLSQAKVTVQVQSAEAREYEAALLDGRYTLAVGFVGGGVVADLSEQLRLATIWFADQLDENARMAEARQVPLFEIQRYALCRNRIEFAGDSLADMFVQRDADTREQGAHE
jgi:hypothetical protein